MSSPQRSPLDEGEIGDDESYEFDDGYDENLMGDEEDKKRLAQMTEKEREQELYNRSERRDTLKFRFEIEKKLKSKAKKREQEKKQSKQVRGRKRFRVSEVFTSDEESSDEFDEYTPEQDKTGSLNEINSNSKPTSKMATRSQPHRSSSSQSSSDSDSASSASPSESGQENNELERRDHGRQSKDPFVMDLAKLKSIQLKRDQIDKWIYAPFFKQTAIGLFVKISVANIPQTLLPLYKVAEIIDITKGSRVYTLNKNKTDKQCLVRIGQVERTYNMSFISNRSFDEEDFTKWIEQLRIDGLDMPGEEKLSKKRDDLKNAVNYEYKDEDIAYEVSERGRFNSHPCNFALKKTELLGEKADAESSNDYARASQIQKEIDELEERARQLEKTRSSSTFSAISFVNERNRYKNIVESERVLKESKSVKTEDPFTRRKCNPTIVHNKNNGDSEPGKVTDKNGIEISKSSNANDSISTPNNSGNKTMTIQESVKSVDDLFQAHSSIDLELDI